MFIIILFYSVMSCELLDGQNSNKPKPSLTKCYRYNKNACCVSIHDSGIQSDYSSLLSSQCQREYDYLEDYFCFGCNPSQDQYTDPIAKTIVICKSYAENVWGGNLLQPSSTFDNCGLTTYWRANPDTIIPSAEWNNAFQFFWEVKPPYFTDYTVIITDDENPCYSFGKVFVIGLVINFII